MKNDRIMVEVRLDNQQNQHIKREQEQQRCA